MIALLDRKILANSYEYQINNQFCAFSLPSIFLDSSSDEILLSALVFSIIVDSNELL